jgi:hypothetical protein
MSKPKLSERLKKGASSQQPTPLNEAKVIPQVERSQIKENVSVLLGPEDIQQLIGLRTNLMMEGIEATRSTIIKAAIHLAKADQSLVDAVKKVMGNDARRKNQEPQLF